MQIAGIITEYNPLHMGHVHLMEEVRRLLGLETAIICVMSGQFVQRGDFALVGNTHALKQLSAAAPIWCWNCRCPGPFPPRNGLPTAVCAICSPLGF